jgi:hypothetical protein
LDIHQFSHINDLLSTTSQYFRISFKMQLSNLFLAVLPALALAQSTTTTTMTTTAQVTATKTQILTKTMTLSRCSNYTTSQNSTMVHKPTAMTSLFTSMPVTTTASIAHPTSTGAGSVVDAGRFAAAGVAGLVAAVLL